MGFVDPCLATPRPAPPTGTNWIHEIKFDGFRMMAVKRLSMSAPANPGTGSPDPATVTLFTRGGFDWTQKFGIEIAMAIRSLPCSAVYLDGEVVAEDDQGRPDFALLQDLISKGVTDRLVYWAFDLLSLNGTDLRPLPLSHRKTELQRLLAGAGIGRIRFSEHFDEGDGPTIFEHSCRLGLEGIVSKRADRPYRSGRGEDWIKSRCRQQERFIVGGFQKASGSSRQVGALLLGQRVARKGMKPALIYKGSVGTGFSRMAARAIWEKLDAMKLSASPFVDLAPKDAPGAVFVEPEVSAEIDFLGLTGKGLLRHASFRGIAEIDPVAVNVTGRRNRSGTLRKR